MIFPGVPGGQVVTILGRRPYNMTQSSPSDHGSELGEQRMKTELATEHCDELPFTDDGKKAIDILQFVSDRLLDIEVAARLRCR